MGPLDSPASQLSPFYKTQWSDLEEWHLRLTSDPHLLMPMHLHAYIQTCTHMHSKRGKKMLVGTGSQSQGSPRAFDI